MNTSRELLLPPTVEAEHDPTKATVVMVPGFCHFPYTATDYTNPNRWYLNQYQKKNPQLELSYILNMIRLAMHELRADKNTYVVFSGGFTNREAGEDSSEAGSYLRVAKLIEANPAEKLDGIDWNRVLLDEDSYNSNHNLWGSISAFYRRFNVCPAVTRAYCYSLKCNRLDLVAAEFGISRHRFVCDVVQGPEFMEDDMERERDILEDMKHDILLLNPNSRHTQLTNERNWSNRPVDFVPLKFIRDYYAGLAVTDGLAILNLPERERRLVQYAAD